MTRSEEPEVRAVHAFFEEDRLCVDLADGRRILVPVAWFPRLEDASSTERESWELLDDGRGIRWPEVDEDLSVAGLLPNRSA